MNANAALLTWAKLQSEKAPESEEAERLFAVQLIGICSSDLIFSCIVFGLAGLPLSPSGDSQPAEEYPVDPLDFGSGLDPANGDESVLKFRRIQSSRPSALTGGDSELIDGCRPSSDGDGRSGRGSSSIGSPLVSPRKVL